MTILVAGILVVDLIAAGIDRIADPGEVVFTPRGIKSRIGGHPANVAIDLVKLGLDGQRIHLMGSVGEDFFGDFIYNTLKGYGINVDLCRINGVETSKNMIFVIRGEDRRFHVDVGANVFLSPEVVVAAIKRLKPQIFYVGATGWLGEFDDKLENVLSTSKNEEALTFTDVIAPYGKGWEYIIPSFKYTDVFHSNDLELLNITNSHDVYRSMQMLSKLGVKLILTTLGEEGLLAAKGDLIIRMPAFRVDTIDPTGAGDAFCSGIIYRLYQDKVSSLQDVDVDTLIDILLFGSAVGASATTMEGTTDGVSRDFVDKLIEENAEAIKEMVMIKRL